VGFWRFLPALLTERRLTPVDRRPTLQSWEGPVYYRPFVDACGEATDNSVCVGGRWRAGRLET